MRIFPYIIILLILFAGVRAAFAHVDSDSETQMEQLMRRMMGERTLEAMEEMEEQMMGAQNHERMEELMNTMLAGTLSSEEQKEMIEMMRDTSAGPGAMNMMMRMMFLRGLENSGALSLGGYGMMEGMGNPIWLRTGFQWTFWITVILMWAFLALGIIALWRWITKK